MKRGGRKEEEGKMVIGKWKFLQKTNKTIIPLAFICSVKHERKGGERIQK